MKEVYYPPGLYKNITSKKERNKKTENVRLRYKNYKLDKNERLIYIEKRGDNIEEYIIPTENNKLKIIKEIHEKTRHTGFILLANEIKNSHKIFWRNIYKDCNNFINQCAICLNQRGGKKIIHPSKHILPGGPLDRVVADTWELPEYLKVKTNYTWVLD